MELALVDVEEVGSEELDEVRARWFEFLDGLDELGAQEAKERVYSFALLLDGLLRADSSPADADAENGSEEGDRYRCDP